MPNGARRSSDEEGLVLAAERAAAYGSGTQRNNIFYEEDLDTYRAITQMNLEMENYDPWKSKNPGHNKDLSTLQHKSDRRSPNLGVVS